MLLTTRFDMENCRMAMKTEDILPPFYSLTPSHVLHQTKTWLEYHHGSPNSALLTPALTFDLLSPITLPYLFSYGNSLDFAIELCKWKWGGQVKVLLAAVAFV